MHRKMRGGSMSTWSSLRKGPTHIFASSKLTTFNNIFADNVEVRATKSIELRMSLEVNLRGRPTNSSDDARELLDEIRSLKTIEIFDDFIYKNLDRFIQSLGDNSPKEWVLVLRLGGRDSSFAVKLEPRGEIGSRDLVL